ncbi:MAG: hypothetical protein AB8G86_25595, partial [Saprospiraceae bacterium]
MSKFHKKNKVKKRKKRRTQTKNIVNINNEIGELILNSKNIEEEAEIWETPFGEIRTHDRMLADSLKNKGVILELLKIDEEVEEDDV